MTKEERNRIWDMTKDLSKEELRGKYLAILESVATSWLEDLKCLNGMREDLSGQIYNK